MNFPFLNRFSTPVKKGILVAGIAVGTVLLVWGGLSAAKAVKKQPVNVYSVDAFALTDYYGDSSSASGSVSSEGIQTVYINETQTVNKIFVEQGESVKKGQKLMSFDTTLSSIDVKKADLERYKIELQIQTAKDELELLKKAQNVSALKSEKARLQAAINAEESSISSSYTAPDLPKGSGTEMNPLYIKFEGIMKPATDLAGGQGYIVYVMLDGSGFPKDYAGFQVTSTTDVLTWNEYSPLSLGSSTTSTKLMKLQAELEEIEALINDERTAAELIQEISDKENLIKEYEIDYKLKTQEYRKKLSEVNDGTVYAKYDGTITSVLDPKEAYAQGKPVIELDGGGGYVIDGFISELNLGDVQVGSEVTISSWMTGMNVTGTITKIEDVPTSNGYSNGNPNASFYPVKIFVQGTAGLQDGDWVEISYQQGSSRNSWYLENFFIRSEGVQNYVYVRDTKNKLEKRFIQTGKCLWGSYTEILGGITLEDYLAFPYGKDVVSGAKTQEADMSQLYNY